ncbi:Lipid-A-disaccharide synthase [hydrothermal vent metagenome]|uniref:lipid-A-disaccharide synthase n=1 Tax=hydrothermal vent metagenome TaxID=652676 RepID=A0A1W1D2S0_9ZZZZ
MKILVSALEHSANIHLASLKKELGDEVEFVGIFDKKLGKSIVDLQSLAIMGFVDALKKIRFFFKLSDEMVQLAKDVDKVLLIDSSGFHLPLAKKLKKQYPHLQITYYILPQAWAWRAKRIEVLEKYIDNLCSILPFEPQYYSKNAPIQYVGHPLLDQIKQYKTSLQKEVKKVVFMPGSRKSEIARLMPIYKELREKIFCEAILVIPKHFTQQERDRLYGDISSFTICDDAHYALYESDFAFICSGTATLEASLIGIPFVLTYIAKPLDYFIAKQFVHLKYIGLANIMFEKMGEEKPLHPEFIQEDVNTKNLLDAFENYEREKFLNNSKKLRKYLQHGSAKNVAKCLLH